MDDISEALLAKDIAEHNIQSMDYTNARRQILRALKFFPTLENGTGMLSVCDVLCASAIELPIRGVDWYWVMQISPTADGPTVEAQHKNLISLLDPIKESFPGTEIALTFIREAYSVLSDPVKRSTFDSKRNGGGKNCGALESQVECVVEIGNVAVDAVHERISMDSGYELPSSSGLKKSVLEVCDEICKSQVLVEVCPIDKEKSDICNEVSCSTSQMVCEVDMSVETSVEVLSDPYSSSTQLVRSNGSCPEAPDYYEFEDNRKMEIFSVGQVWAVFDTDNMPRCYALIDKIVSHDSDIKLYITRLKPHPLSLHEKNWRSPRMPVACGSFVLESNKVALSGCEIFSHLLSESITSEPFEIYPKKGEVWALYRDWNNGWLTNPGMRKDCAFEVVEILTDYMKDTGVAVAYLTKVDGFRNIFQQYKKGGKELSFNIPSDKLFMFSHNVPMFRFKGGEVAGVANDMLELDPLVMSDHLNQDSSFAFTSCQEAPSSPEARIDCLPVNSATTTNNSSLDTGIQNHKPKWLPKDLGKEQIWAVYNGPDAMPRLYVKIVDMISQTCVSVALLEPHPMLDDEISWVMRGMPYVCGFFREGNLISSMDVSKFSHTVKCEQSTNKSFYRIFPQKGEVWAMYKNWNMLSWQNSDLIKHDYRIVEILSDFSEESGISICSLIEVRGYKTFFQRQLYENFQLTRQISRLEMLSFSHCIPAFSVVGVNSSDIPEEAWHLEPKSLPPPSRESL